MAVCNIGQAASATGVSAKMIRHYEAVGLLPKARRTFSGYREYSDADLHTLRFIRHARDLGFSIKHIADLVSLWQNRRRSSSKVKALAQAHIAELTRKAAETLAMKKALEHLVHSCHGDERPECPILEALGADHTGVTQLAASAAPRKQLRNRTKHPAGRERHLVATPEADKEA